MLHIVFDDKFIDGAISLFEIDNRVNNTYIIIGEKKEFKYIKSANILFVSSESVIDFINSYDVVVIHSLPSIPLEILKDIKGKVKVVWYAWGYDMYNKPYNIIPVKLLQSETKKHTKYERFRKYARLSYLCKEYKVHKYLKAALNRIDFFSGVFPYEIDLIKECHPEFKALPLDFYYGAKDFFIPEHPEKEIRHGKKNIMIGNSADMMGNHLDVLNVLSNIKIDKEAKVIIPLSYGGSPSYVDKVIQRAEIIAPGQIVSLREYLPLRDYLNLISNCKTAIFAHERQQASDNIFMQMIYGARVYMSETSSAFKYLQEIGLKVYSLQSDLNLFNEEMCDEDVMNNRMILSSLYSSSELIKRVEAINTTLMEVVK